jgi:epoxyqueuosine reductase QueG
MNVNKLIRECATSEGADFFGVADVVPAREAIREQGGDLVASFPRAVSIGLKLFHTIVDQLPLRLEDNVHAQNYGHHCYTVINQRLDLIVSKVADLLQTQGHRVYPVPASQTINTARSIGVFSNKMAAHMAGLGWIGKSCLLVTPENGPRCRWATVLTDAPLAQTGQPMDTRCGDCRKCVDACPAQAFTGKNFREDEHRDVRFDTKRCIDYREKCHDQYGVKECGICLWACPHGKAASQKLSSTG